MESIYKLMNKIDDKESLNEKYNIRTSEDVKKLQESTYSDRAVAWYVDSGTADEEAEEWCKENPEDWNISHPRFVERAIDWYESSYYSTLYDEEDDVDEDYDNDNSIMSDYGFEEGENDMNDLYFYKEDSDDVVVTVHGNDAVKGVKCPDAGRVIKRPTKVTLADGDEETVLGVIDAEYEVSSFADYYVLNDSRIEDKVWKTLNNYLKSQREAQTEGRVVREEVD